MVVFVAFSRFATTCSTQGMATGIGFSVPARRTNRDRPRSVRFNICRGDQRERFAHLIARVHGEGQRQALLGFMMMFTTPR